MPTETSWVGLRLDPLDTLFFRDGRPFDAATRASGGLPQPQTLAGALRTALLARTYFDFRRFATLRKDDPARMRDSLTACGAPAGIVGASFRGPWLALAESDSDTAVLPLLPMPEVLKRAKKDKNFPDVRWSVASPRERELVPGWPDEKEEPLNPLWRAVEPDPKADTELLTLVGLKAFLAGKEPAEAEVVKKDELFKYDHRVGIEVDKHTFTSADGMLYVISLLATKPKHEGKPVCLYAEMELPTDMAAHLKDAIVPFGGEGKYVRVRTVTKQDWPKSAGGSAMWYLATPTFFPPTGRPLPKLANGTLIAAASGAGVPISGWDVARNGPRATRFAVPAGAVYFVEGDVKPTDFLNTGNESESKDLRQEGWGFALPGIWEDLK